MATINVLIFPAGEVNSIELHDALSTCVNVRVFGASSIERHGGFVFANYISGLPFINDVGFLEAFNKIICENRIDVVIPTHDTVAKFFSENRDNILARVLVAGKKTTAICRDKSLTYELFSDTDFVPTVYADIPSDFPVFIKPREGQGGVGARLIHNLHELPENLMSYVVSEYLPGDEYTVDCLTDKKGNLIVVSPRSRKRLMAGVCVAGSTEPLTDDIKNIAEEINRRLSFLGLWYFQIKKDISGRWKLLEISTRCAGSMCLTRARGLNLPLISIYVAMGYDVEAVPNNAKITMDRTLITRYITDYYYDTVYFDFDDTLVVRGKVNLKAIWFLYQCRNQGKKVVLLTKHERVLRESMERYAISPNLFESVIQIQPDAEKADFVKPKNAIFIDNAYKERESVRMRLGIPVYDVDEIEVLMDWRV